MPTPNALVGTFIYVTRAGDDINNEIVKVTGVKDKGILLVQSLDGSRSGKFSIAEQKRVISGYEGENENDFDNVMADSKDRQVTKPPIFLKKSDENKWLKLNDEEGKLDVPQEWSSKDESNATSTDYPAAIEWDDHKKNLDAAMEKFEIWLASSKTGGDEAPSGAGGAATTSGGTGGEGDPTSSGAGGGATTSNEAVEERGDGTAPDGEGGGEGEVVTLESIKPQFELGVKKAASVCEDKVNAAHEEKVLKVNAAREEQNQRKRELCELAAEQLVDVCTSNLLAEIESAKEENEVKQLCVKRQKLLGVFNKYQTNKANMEREAAGDELEGTIPCVD